MHIYIYIYIYNIYTHLYIYIYVSIYTYTYRERDIVWLSQNKVAVLEPSLAGRLAPRPRRRALVLVVRRARLPAEVVRHQELAREERAAAYYYYHYHYHYY